MEAGQCESVDIGGGSGPLAEEILCTALRLWF